MQNNHEIPVDDQRPLKESNKIDQVKNSLYKNASIIHWGGTIDVSGSFYRPPNSPKIAGIKESQCFRGIELVLDDSGDFTSHQQSLVVQEPFEETEWFKFPPRCTGNISIY
ncbi:hypothetical protein AYI70_g11745 [Smittium culicis]|uniref:Uncharacterized protein n=1 Tax=Smittium culicis TaxID=133412 RepID=A0A1R1X0G4_9FUNG|nr:hypothetical protein AYI70_g11745 [Smittium culicis]